MVTTPAQMALEYRIWAFANPLGWNVTPSEIAAELGVSRQFISAALKRKGWSHRVRGAAHAEGQGGISQGQAAHRTLSRTLADDVAHGRINMSVD